MKSFREAKNHVCEVKNEERTYEIPNKKNKRKK